MTAKFQQRQVRGTADFRRSQMPYLNTVVPASLVSALHVEATRTGETASSIVTAALAQYLGKK
jgi:hypothetical protein